MLLFYKKEKENVTLIMNLLLDYIAKDYIGWNHYVMLNDILESYYKKNQQQP